MNLDILHTDLKAFRKAQSLTVLEFAARYGFKSANVYKWEKGTKPTNYDDLQKLESILTGGALTPPPSGGWPGIPVYEASPITATNTEVYHDERIDKPDFYLNVPALRDCNYAARARGDSMHPKISNGDIVIGKELMDASVILFGEIYIIHTRNGIETVKYIHPCDDDSDCLELVPLNSSARKTRIKKTDIARLFEYRAVFKL